MNVIATPARLGSLGLRMNIHHLELFYYVARHGGISRAVRNMPYGIQQPAVSSQVLLLEEDLGAKLFERQPFRLTREGEELYAFIRPFFENLPAMGAKLRQQSDLAVAKLEELKTAGEDSWEKMVAEMEKIRDAFVHSFSYFKSQIK